MSDWLFICTPGLEDVLADEAREKLGWRIDTVRGMVFASAYEKTMKQDGEPCWELLKCADNVYRIIGQGEVGPHKADLPALGAWAAECIEWDALSSCAKPQVRVTASRRGKHSYSRFQAAAAVEAALVSALGWLPGDETRHDVALRLDIDNHKVMLSEKRSDAAFRFRGERTFLQGALRPTLAHALVRLSRPQPEDVFVDPFCGSGTIPLERAVYPAAAIHGIDIEKERMRIAQQNDTKGIIQWQQGDALQLPMEAQSIDAVVTNPPWGMQLDTPGDLCVRFLRSLHPLMRDQGRVILLQPDMPIEKDWNVQRLHTLSLHGTLVGVWYCTPH